MIIKLQFEMSLEVDTIQSYCNKIFLLKNQKQYTLGALLFVWHGQ